MGLGDTGAGADGLYGAWASGTLGLELVAYMELVVGYWLLVVVVACCLLLVASLDRTVRYSYRTFSSLVDTTRKGQKSDVTTHPHTKMGGSDIKPTQFDVHTETSEAPSKSGPDYTTPQCAQRVSLVHQPQLGTAPQRVQHA